MRIEELILEGFKSYPQRTTITGWDSSFNAITGLNGSGKSNILDAICFVLGITNLSHMRAQNLQDLVYKRGQAGVTRASVTVIFDNSDRVNSPAGYEHCAQITVTRQIILPNTSKYMLQGKRADAKQIHTFFQSVQLNINNPNFVIMQGRITKVLNMKPQEILGMVEEAAGTRMYEEKKASSVKSMAKKAKKIAEIELIQKEEIVPKLEKLKKEKQAYVEYTKSESELQRTARLLKAWEWMEANKRIESKGKEIEGNETKTKELKQENKERVGKSKDTQKNIDEAVKARKKELEKGGMLTKYEQELAGVDKELEKIKTQIDIKKREIKEETTALEHSTSQLEQLRRAVEEKVKYVADLHKNYDGDKKIHDADTKALENAEELLQSLLTGVGNSGNTGGGGYMGQLADARQRIAQASAVEEQTKRKLATKQEELKTLQKRWKAVESEAKDGKLSLERLRAEAEKLKKQLSQCGWSTEQETTIDTELREARNAFQQASQTLQHAREGMGSLDFQYTSPHPNFDRSKVKGLVATLVSLDKENFNKATALEIAAGGRLYNVVVENEQVGKELIMNGKLRKRVTIIPLNKINAFKASAYKLEAAHKTAPGKVDLALTLVGYSEEVSNAMAYVFGDTLVCADAATAKAVTFNPHVNMKSVTLQGDVYDPSGTLTGGAPPSGNGVLIEAQRLQGQMRVVEGARVKMEKLERVLRENEGSRAEWRELKKRLDMKEHEANLAAQSVEGSNAAKIGAEIEEAKAAIELLQQELSDVQKQQKDGKAEVAKLERDMSEFKNNKEGKIEELKENISDMKKKLQKHSVSVKTKYKAVSTAELELAQLKEDVTKAEEGLVEENDAIETLKEKLHEQEDQQKVAKEAHAKVEAALKEERAKVSKHDKAIERLNDILHELGEETTAADEEIDKLKHTLATLTKEHSAAMNFVSQLETQNDWIVEEQEHFGKRGSPYDFEGQDMKKMQEKVDTLETRLNKQKGKLNPSAINQIETTEKQESTNRKRINQVIKDKAKIEATIAHLDGEKLVALEKTWGKVSADFGAIFAELLPGNFAKLQPPEGKTVMDGLEVKVQLGSVWKQSLTELSGGQRSLIALSLIMALLQFKPAPMYILDEIDAALDLQHTQNIGRLFRTRFKGSQFIVVSLKEGLFTNANVLFKARFRDGTSIVERTAQRSR